jgi:hypothetical protein
LGYHSPHSYVRAYERQVALSTSASETSKKIEAMPVVDKADRENSRIFKKLLLNLALKKGELTIQVTQWDTNFPKVSIERFFHSWLFPR